MKRWVRLILALALAANAVGSAAQSRETLRIGLAGPFPPANAPTGDKIFGDEMRTGVEFAVADINKDGGLLGHKVKITIRDDASDPKRGVEVAKAFVKDDIKLVVGPFSSAVAVPASTVYGEAGVLDITPSATGDLVTDRGLQTIFRTCGREDQQGAVAAAFLRDRRFARIAIVHDRSPAGKALADDVQKAVAASGTSTVVLGSFGDEPRSLGELAGRLRSARTEIVFFGGGPCGAARLARRLHDAETPIPLLGGSAIASDEFVSQAGPAADGSMVIFPKDPSTRPAAADLLRRLTAKKANTGAYVFNAYAAVQVIRQAADATQSLDPGVIAKHMHSGTTFQTVLGPIAFDAKGDPKTSDLTVYVWHKGATGRWNFLTPADS